MSIEQIAFIPTYASVAKRPAFAWQHCIIRGLDISLSLIALIFVLPVMLLIIIAIFAEDRGPIFFAHRRVGFRGQIFPCYKFRSMVPDSGALLEHVLAADPHARLEWAGCQKLRRDPRITRVGAFVRKTSLDELPQLINVLLGHMSLVGPRPIVVEEVPRYGRYFSAYCAQRPGITGLWQISGRNHTSYRRRVAIDTFFSRSLSVQLYLYVLMMTPRAVVSARGCY